MKSLLFALILSASTFAHAAPIPFDHDNYCKDDVYNYVASRFGPETQITKIFKVSGTSGMTYYYYFQVDACDGDIIAAFTGEGWQCAHPQHGQRVQFLNHVYTLSESCNQFIPYDEYPDLYPNR